MKTKIALFHFSPVELFPPVMNLLNYLQALSPEEFRVQVYTTRPDQKIQPYVPFSGNLRIFQFGHYTFGKRPFFRYVQYGIFHWKSFWNCLRWHPGKIIYFETLSAAIPWLIRNLFFRQTEVFIHYHEYMTPGEYHKMFINRIFRQIEIRNYSHAKWISHTNSERMAMFLKDIGRPGLGKTHILPNYPPKRWKQEPSAMGTDSPIRSVYIGSLSSLGGLYIPEICEWIKSLRGQLTLDLYSLSIGPEVRSYLGESRTDDISWKGPVQYEELPKVLQRYQVGLILYKGGPLNTVFSASNKLFEYLACGLDVWYPTDLKGTFAFDSETLWPKVLRLNFGNLYAYNLRDLTVRQQGNKREIAYFFEDAIQEFITCLQN